MLKKVREGSCQAIRGSLRCQTSLSSPTRQSPSSLRMAGGSQGAGLAAPTPLHDAVRAGDAAVITGLLQEDTSSVDALDCYSRTPLMWASYAGHVDSTSLLLTHGASIDMKDWCGDTALHEACFKGHKDVADLLLTRGADPGIRDQWGWTALMAAAGTGRVSIVRALLKHQRVNVNQVDFSGRTALWRASCNNHPAVVEVLLLEGHADPMLPDMDGVTALAIAQGKGHDDCAKLIGRYKQSEPIFMLVKSRRLTDDRLVFDQTTTHHHLDGEKQVPVRAALALSLVTAKRSLRAPTYLQGRLSRGEALPVMDVKVGTKKRAKKDEQLRAAVAYVVKDMGPQLFEELLDLLCDRGTESGHH